MHRPEAIALLAGLVLEDGRAWGDAAEPWQWADARAVLEGRARLAYLTRPRGGAKTSDGAGYAVAALLTQLPAGSRSYAVAVDRDQGALILDSIAGYAERTHGLAGALTIQSWRVTANASGATLDVLAADSAGAYGLRPHLLIADEFAHWGTTPEPRRLWTALFSALPKVADSRCVILTSAGDPAHPAAKLLDRARSDEAWYVAETPGPCPWVSEEDLAQQRAELTVSQYARLHLNQWIASEDRLVDPEALRACVTLDGPLEPRRGVTYRIGVDIGLRHDRTAIAVCHAEPVAGSTSRRVVLDRMIVLSGTREREVQLSDVEAAIVEAWRAYGGRVRLDPWQAIGLKQRLSALRVSVEEFAFGAQSVGRLASTLHLLLRDRLLALPPDEALLDELARVRLRETAPGVLRIDHDPGEHDDRAIALALAATALVERPAGRSRITQMAATPLPGLGALPSGLRRVSVAARLGHDVGRGYTGGAR